MNIEGYEQWIKLNKNLTTPLSEWNKAATDVYQHMTEHHLAMIRDNFSHLSNQFKRFSDVKKLEDLLDLQKECLNDDLNLLIEDMQKCSQTSLESLEELAKLWGSATHESVTTIARKVKEKTKKTSKIAHRIAHHG